MAKMIHEKSNETRIVENVLAEAAIGQIVSYDQLTKAIGKPILLHRSVIASARRSLLRTNKLVFGCVFGVGLRRLNDEQVVDTIDGDRLRLRRLSTRSLDKLATVNFSALPADAQTRHVVASAQLGAIAMFATRRSRNQIESKVIAEAGKALSINDTLLLFGG